MRKNIFKRIATAAVTAAMIVASLPVMAFAADEVPTIDTTKPVSLTLTKYIAESGDTTELSGTVTGIQQNIKNHTPLADVDFTLVKFAVFEQENNGERVQMRCKLTAEGASILQKEADLNGTGATYEEGQTVSIERLKNFATNKTARGPVFTGIENIPNAVTATTGADGIVKFTSQTVADGNKSVKHIDGQGLYIVVETKAPDTVTSRTHPFFVSLPLSDRTNLNQWLYDVYAYPKNSTGEISIDKQIYSVNGDTESSNTNIADDNNSAEAYIGDTIRFDVMFTMAIPDGGLKKLSVVDTMSSGLTFKKAGSTAASTDVTVKRADTNATVATNKYNVTATVNAVSGITTLNVTFTDAYIKELNEDSNKLPEFEIMYNAVLNEKAVLGSAGNVNTVQAIYRTNVQPTSEPDKKTDENKAKVYTWGINLTKVGENDAALSDVEFKLTDDGNKAYKFVKTDGGYYVPSDDASASEILKTDSAGRLRIHGLKSDVYSLKETKTKAGYVLLNDAVEIVIDGDNSTGIAKASVNGRDATLSSMTANGQTSTTARVEVKIVNNRGFLLPSTGGVGTTMFTIIGITVISISAALLIMLRRKAKTEKN